jgi:2-polyprenyl-6-methoxyphenol hydroxylase-like FAD-dependent oxidoreductase
VSWPIIHLVTVTGATWAISTAVLMVGGGPAGLAAAAELGLHGIECVVIEPRAAVSHLRPRAKTTNVRTMEHLRRWGVADALRAAAPPRSTRSPRPPACTES